ncbi:MAG: hypothetical protein V3U30_03225 [Thermoplasmata archaeon]
MSETLRRGLIFTIGALALSTLLLFSFVASADGWIEDWDDHTIDVPLYEYHVHAYVGADAYTGTDERCHYRDWIHSKNDTRIIDDPWGLLSIFWGSADDSESGWTRSSIYEGGFEIDYEYVYLPDYPICPE